MTKEIITTTPKTIADIAIWLIPDIKCPEVHPPASLAPIIMIKPAKKLQSKRESIELFLYLFHPVGMSEKRNVLVKKTEVINPPKSTPIKRTPSHAPELFIFFK